MKKLISGSILLLLVACSPKTSEIIEVVKEEPKEVETTESESVKAGSLVYNENCGKCHYLKHAEDFTADQWKKIVPDMAQKSKLSLEQEASVLTYVLAYAKK